MARSKRSNKNKASDIKTQNNPPLSSSDTDQQTQASLESQQHSKDELMTIIQRQNQKNTESNKSRKQFGTTCL